MSELPISFDDVLDARRRIAPYLSPTPLYAYAELDETVGQGIRVFVKHENFNPTNSFKVRNGLSFMSDLTAEQRERGVVAATRGNHGLGVAFAGRVFDARVTICVPVGNNPEKNAGMRALGARLIEEGLDYDEAVAVADRIRRAEGATLAHSTNDTRVIAGAGTLSLEMLERQPTLDAIVMGIGGGSQAVGALAVASALKPGLSVYGVQAAGAAAGHDSWHTGQRVYYQTADTIADGLATRTAYEMTFMALRHGLTDFITVTDGEIAESVRLLLRITHSLVEPAGAAGLAGLRKLAPRLAGKSVGIVVSGANVDAGTLRRILNAEI